MKYRITHKLLVAAAGILAGAGPMNVHAQQAPAFEVASIRLGEAQPKSAGLQLLPSGRLVASNYPLELLIQEVYKVSAFQVVGLGQWTSGWGNTRFDIQAKASGPASRDQLKIMAQTLLADRFQLRFHREAREISVYALTAARGGIKLTAAKDNGAPRGTGGINATWPMGRMFGNNVSMDHFVQILSEQQLDRPVVDKTNFTEPFDFNLEYAAIDRPDAAGPSIFTALQEQLGLRLDPVKLPVDVMVIDHIEKPAAN